MLQVRLQKRLADLKLEAQISPLPPVVLGGLLVVPKGLLDAMAGRTATTTATSPTDTQASAARARAVVMAVERGLGFEPTDRELEKLGYDVESRVPHSGKLRFIEVKGRDASADTITVTRNEILYSLNKPEDFILAIVEFLRRERTPRALPPAAVPAGARLRCDERQLRSEGSDRQGGDAAVTDVYSGERAARELIAEASRIVGFTGAGISTESGVPDFRSPDGVWARNRTVYFQEFLSSEAGRVEYWRQKIAAWPDMREARPNARALRVRRTSQTGSAPGIESRRTSNACTSGRDCPPTWSWSCMAQRPRRSA